MSHNFRRPSQALISKRHQHFHNMCGRYALGIRASFVRHQMQQQGFQVDEAPNDENDGAARQTHNFPPGAYGLVYRADVPDNGVATEEDNSEETDEPRSSQATKYDYQLKVMKWGLIPFWTKRSPDYGSMMRTINCRDDSLIENRGMWTTMKQKKRCLVVAQGFYEWLKKGPGGKEKVPHFVKRKDGQLMLFAGLWDCVRYEDSEEKLYTYTIITTDSNKQLNFLHDRMPVILDPNTEGVNVWLDPGRNKWSKDLQSLLKPFEGELECYPVSKEVGKVGNDSPNFIVPVDSKENKNNIGNFFNNARKIHKEAEEDRATKDHESTEDNAPIPTPIKQETRQKRKLEDEGKDEGTTKAVKMEPTPAKSMSPVKTASRTTRSATSNEGASMKLSPTKKTEPGAQRITQFFGK